MPGVIALDVEPGGATTPIGFLGVAELIDDEIAATFQVQFASPVCDWSCEQHGPPFAEVWPWLEAFIADRVVAVHGVGHDRGALIRLFDAAGLGLPELHLVDTLGMIRHRYSGSCGLQALVLSLGLLSHDEIEWRRLFHRLDPQRKWLLHNARDDALACAELLRWMVRQEATSLECLLDGAEVVTL